MDIIYDRNNEGAWVLSTFIGNEYYKKIFYFYTKKEATQVFRQFVEVDYPNAFFNFCSTTYEESVDKND